MDFTLDKAKGILRVKYEFNFSWLEISLFNKHFLKDISQFFVGKHINSMSEFIRDWDTFSEEFNSFMNLKFLGYALSL